MSVKIGDKVTFNNDQIELFKEETDSNDRAVREYRNLVLAGINQIGIVKEYGHAITTVSFEDGWELPMPTKYLVVLPKNVS